jgi:hypothetical protein
MKTKTLSLSRTDFPVVSSLDNLEVGRIYTTFKPEIIKSLEFNRGAKDGFLPERVAALQAKFDTGLFYMNVCHVLVNSKGKAIDGNNRKKMLSNNKQGVNFMITAQPEFNLDNESEILNNVSEYNSVNSAWNGKDAYESALAFNEAAAVAIDKLKTWVENTYGINADIFTPSRLIAIVTKFKQGLNGKVQPRRAYCNKETASVLESPEFKEHLLFLVNVIQFVQSNNNSITAFDVVRCLLPIMWKKELSQKVVLANVKKRGFKGMDNTKMAGVKARVTEILKIGNV